MSENFEFSLENKLIEANVSCDGSGIEVEKTNFKAFEERALLYLELLLKWNKKMDLVSPAPAKQIFEKHILDSLICALVAKKHVPEASNIMDVGSGAGFPGVLLALVCQNSPTLLVEPRAKRVVFLKELRRALGLKNVEIYESRLEDLPEIPPLGLLTSRGLGLREALLELAGPNLGSQGAYLEMFSGDQVGNEGLEHPKFSLEHQYLYNLPESGSKRALLFWKKQ